MIPAKEAEYQMTVLHDTTDFSDRPLDFDTLDLTHLAADDLFVLRGRTPSARAELASRFGRPRAGDTYLVPEVTVLRLVFELLGLASDRAISEAGGRAEIVPFPGGRS
jgi:hypothetical protein